MGCSDTVCKKYFPLLLNAPLTPQIKNTNQLFLNHRPCYTLQCTNGAHIKGLRLCIIISVLGGVNNNPFFVLGRRKKLVGRG